MVRRFGPPVGFGLLWSWGYDLRTNMHFTLKTKTLREADLAG
jgi:hypothetical protein